MFSWNEANSRFDVFWKQYGDLIQAYDKLGEDPVSVEDLRLLEDCSTVGMDVSELLETKESFYANVEWITNNIKVLEQKYITLNQHLALYNL